MKNNDITKTGPVGLKGLQGINRRSANELTLEQNQATLVTPQFEYIGNPELGQSTYDTGITDISLLRDLNDTRANLQPTLDKWGAGLAKMGTLATTTFLNSTIGLGVGLATAATKGEWNGLWNNEFNKTMNQINEGSEEVFKNYYSKEELENPWYKNIGTTNFWADGILKNMGFTIGAIGAGALTGNALSALLNGVKGGQFITSAAATLAAATGEASVEALNTYKNTIGDENKQGTNAWLIKQEEDKEIQALVNNYSKIFQAIDNTPDKFIYERGADGQLKMNSKNELMRQYYKLEFDDKVAFIQQKAAQNKDKLQEEALKAGNITMALNQAVLSISDAALFGKTLMGGYANARKGLALGFLNKATKEILTGAKEIAEGIAKNEVEAVANKGFGKQVAKNIATNFLSEGAEEGSQNLISNTAQINAAHNLNTYAGHKINPKVSDEVDGFITAGAQALAELYGSLDSPGWQEVVMGGIGGVLGTPIFKRNGKGNIRPAWAGGVVEAYEDAKDKFASNEVVDLVNQNIQDPKFVNRYQGLVRRQSLQNIMDVALKEGNEFNYKDSEAAQLTSDILMFRKANQIDVLKSLFDTSANITDEEVTKLLPSFRIDGTNKNLKEGESIAQVKENIQETARKLSQLTTDISKIHDYHLTKFGDKFNDEQLEELTFLASGIKHHESNFIDNIDKVKESLRDIVNILPEDSEHKENLNSLLTLNNSLLYNTLLEEDNLLEKGGAIDALLAENSKRYVNVTQELEKLNKLKETLNSKTVSAPVQLGRARKRISSSLDALNTQAEKLKEQREVIFGTNLFLNYQDAIASVRMSKILQNKYDNYINNDGLLASEINEDKINALQIVDLLNYDNTKTSLSTVQDHTQFREFIDKEKADNNPNIDNIVEELVKEGNQFAKDYKELNSTLNSLYNTIEDLSTLDFMELEILQNPNINIVELLDEFISTMPESSIQDELVKARGIVIKNANNASKAKPNNFTITLNPILTVPELKASPLLNLNIGDSNLKAKKTNQEIEKSIDEIFIPSLIKLAEKATSEKRKDALPFNKERFENKIKSIKNNIANKNWKQVDSELTELFAIVNEALGLSKRDDNMSAEETIMLMGKMIFNNISDLDLAQAVINYKEYVVGRGDTRFGFPTMNVAGIGKVYVNNNGSTSFILTEAERRGILTQDYYNNNSELAALKQSTLNTNYTQPNIEGFTPEYNEGEDTTISDNNNNNKKANQKESLVSSKTVLKKKFLTSTAHDLNIDKRNKGVFEDNEIANTQYAYLNNYLRNVVKAFEFVNKGGLKPKELIYFIKDPNYIKQAPKDLKKYAESTIFMAVKRGDNYLIVGVLLETGADKYEGLINLRESINAGYNSVTNRTTKYVHPITVELAEIMPGYVKTSTNYSNLKTLTEGRTGEVKFAIMENGILSAGKGKENEALTKLIKPIQGAAYREGRLYMLIKGADGMYIPMLVKVDRLVPADNGKSVLDIGLFKDEIFAAIKAMSVARTPEQLKDARNLLNNWLYVGEQHIDFVYPNGDKTQEPFGIKIRDDLSNPDGTIIKFKDPVKKSRSILHFGEGDNIGTAIADPTAEELKVEEEEFELAKKVQAERVELELLEAFKKANLYLQISTNNINTKLGGEVTYNEALIETGVLSSNIESMDVVSGWFFTGYVNDNNEPTKAQLTLQPITNTASTKALKDTDVVTRVGNMTYYVDMTGTKPIIKNDKGMEVSDLGGSLKEKLILELAHYNDTIVKYPALVNKYTRTDKDTKTTYYLVVGTENNTDNVRAYNVNEGTLLNQALIKLIFPEFFNKEVKSATPQQVLINTIQEQIPAEIAVDKEIELIKPGVSELFESNPELASIIYEALGFKIRSVAGEFSYHYGGDEKSLYEVMKYYDAAIVNKENPSKFDKFSILISDFLRNYITEDSDIKVRFLNFGSDQSAVKFFGENVTAHYNVKRNTIFINGDKHLTNTDAINIINHEIIHAITYYLYNNNVNFKSRLDRLYNYSIKHVSEIDRKYYGFKNELEFIAEAISNPDFAGLLDTIKSTNKNNTEKSLLDEIIEVVKDALKVFRRGFFSEDRSVLNDIFELINENHLDKNGNVVTEQQKQQAQQLYSQYLDQTGRQDIEGFKEFVNKNNSKPTETKPEVTTQVNDAVANKAIELLGFDLEDDTDSTFEDDNVKLSKELIIDLVSSGKSITFVELPSDVLGDLIKKNYTEQSWDNAKPDLLLRELKCLYI